MTAISCKQNQELSKMTLYFENGVTKSGFTPKKSYFYRGETLEWRKKEKGIWFHEMNAEYLESYTIDNDSFSIVPIHAKSKIFAIHQIAGPVDLFLHPHIADSCATSDLLEALDFVGDMLELVSVASGEEQCPEEFDPFEDDDCQEIIQYPTLSYLLVNQELKKKLLVTRSNFSRERLLEFFINYPSFQKQLYENNYTFDDLPAIVDFFNESDLNAGISETSPISLARFPAKIIIYAKRNRIFNNNLTMIENGKSTSFNFRERPIQEISTSDVLNTSFHFENGERIALHLTPNAINYIELNARRSKRPTLKKVDSERGADWVNYLESVHNK